MVEHTFRPPSEVKFFPEETEKRIPPELGQLLCIWEEKKELEGWTRNRINDLARVAEVPVAQLETQVKAALVTLQAHVKRLSEDPKIQTIWHEHIDQELPAISFVEAEHEAIRLLKGSQNELNEIATNILRGDSKRTRLETEKDAAWAMTGVAPIEGEMVLIMQAVHAGQDPDSFGGAREDAARSWQSFIENLAVLPGPHHAALGAYLKDRNANTVLALLHSTDSPGNFRDLEIDFTRADYDRLQTLVVKVTADAEATNERFIVGMTEACELFGENFYGPAELKKVFGLEISDEKIPAIPYTQEQLENAHKNGFMLVLFADKDSGGKKLSVQSMEYITRPLYETGRQEGRLFKHSRGTDLGFRPCYDKEAPTKGWKLVAREPLPTPVSESAKYSFTESTRVLRNYLDSIGMLSSAERLECAEDVLTEIDRQMESEYYKDRNSEKVSEKVRDFAINQNHRLSFSEHIALVLLAFHTRGIRLFENSWVVTKSDFFDERYNYHGHLATVGPNNTREGIDVEGSVCFQCSATLPCS